MFCMGTITVNVDDDIEERFRKCARDKLSIGKGKLGQAVKEAFELWIKEQAEQDTTKRQLALLEKGFYFGKYVFKRDELYD